jgi:hypothetical protein
MFVVRGPTLGEYLNGPMDQTIGFRIPLGVHPLGPFSPFSSLPIRIISINNVVLNGCTLTDSIKKEIRSKIDSNINNSELKNITITFSHQPQGCDPDSGKKIVTEYKNEYKNELKKKTTEEVNTLKKEINTLNALTTLTPEQQSELNNKLKVKQEYLKKVENHIKNTTIKYNKIDNEITKIKLYLNNEEYKEIPYSGLISDKYYEKLFTHSFDLFPTKKLKN